MISALPQHHLSLNYASPCSKNRDIQGLDPSKSLSLGAESPPDRGVPEFLDPGFTRADSCRAGRARRKNPSPPGSSPGRGSTPVLAHGAATAGGLQRAVRHLQQGRPRPLPLFPSASESEGSGRSRQRKATRAREQRAHVQLPTRDFRLSGPSP